jgi:hypothetical protein
MDNFTKLLIRYAVYLNKECDCIVNGFFSDSDPEAPALSVYKIKSNEDAVNAADKLYDYFNNRIRVYLRVLAPVENTFKLIKIYFNMHFRVEEDAEFTSLLPLTTINDVVKVFFTLGEFTIWDQILKSQPSYVPTEHLLDEYKSAYLNFRLQDALKCRILLQILDENIDNINHYMRLLYSPSETLFSLSESIHIVFELLSDFAHLESNRTLYKKFKISEIFEFYEVISQDVEVAMLDNHNIICEGNQIKIMNHLYEITKYLPQIETKEFPENLDLIEMVMGKLRIIYIL